MLQPTPVLELYTDGSVQPDSRASAHLSGATYGGAYAYHLSDVSDPSLQLTGCGSAWTFGINCMELRAVAAGLQAAPEGSAVTVYSDSRNALGWLGGTFAARQPQIRDELQAVQAVIAARRLQVTYVKVPGHSGVAGNEWCDAAARAELGSFLGSAGPAALSLSAPSTTGSSVPSVGFPAPAQQAHLASSAAQALPVAGDAFELHLTASGPRWTASLLGPGLSGPQQSGASADNVQAWCEALLAGLRAAPEGASVRLVCASDNHVRWALGTQRAKVPRIVEWLARIRQTVVERDLRLSA